MRTNTLSFAEKPTLEEIAGALRCIPSQLAYGDWLKICAAVHAAYPGEDGQNVIEQWSPGYDGEVAEKFKSFNRTNRSTVATLFHFAKQHGWTKGRTAPVTYNKVAYKPSAPAASFADWDEPKQKRAVIASHNNLATAGTKFAWQCMEYLQGRCIDPETVKAFGIGYTAYQLPNTWDGKAFVYPKQLAISLPWFNHDGALVAVKYRFIDSHTYTDKDGKDRTENKTSRGQAMGNVFGWQALRGADNVDVLIICEGEMNALSLWQAGRGAVDVLSTGSEATTKKLAPVVVDMAKQYKHKIVWADKKEIANAAALQIGGASMGSPNGMDANDLLQAGQLGAWFEYTFKRLGLTFPATPSVTESVTGHQSPVTDTLLTKVDELPALPAEQKARPLRPVDRVASLAEQLRTIAALPSFDERLDALEPLHTAIGALSCTEVRDPSIVAELLNIFRKQSSVDAFLKKYGALEPEAMPTDPAPTDPAQLAYYQHYVGKIVSDAQMTVLILAANRHGFQVTFDAQGDWRQSPCDYLVTSARFV